MDAFTGRTQGRRYSLAAVVAVLLVVVALGPGVAVVGAQGSNGGGDKDKVTVDNKCTGGFFEKRTCQMMNSMIGWLLTMVADFVQGVITDVVNMIVGLPVPRHNGERAIFQPPTNEPWTDVYEKWWTKAVPIGLLIWVLMVAGVFFSQVYISDPSTELKRRELKHRSWKVLFGILGSWALGATVLHIADGVILTVAPDGNQVANSLGTFMGNLQSVALVAILVYVFGGVLFLWIMLVLLVQKAMVFMMMWSLPILIPLAAFDVGPIEPLSKPARGIIDLFFPFIFLTLPMALVLRVGYIVINGLSDGVAAEITMTLSGTNALLILGFWILAAVSPLFVFKEMGRVKGFAAGMLGAAVSKNVGETVQDAKERVDWHVPPRYDKGPETHDPTDGRETSSHGGFGGELGGGGTERQSMLDAWTQRDQSDDGGFTGPSPGSPAPTGTDPVGTSGSPSVRANGGQTTDSTIGTGRTTASSSATATGAETGSDRMISPEDVTHVDHPRDLPSEPDYQVGRIKDSGEFQPVESNMQWTRSRLLTGGYNRLNSGTRAYSDDKLLLRSRDDGAFYDMDSMSYREQSYEQMSRETSEDVLNS
jgi:hypothetical protein